MRSWSGGTLRGGPASYVRRQRPIAGAPSRQSPNLFYAEAIVRSIHSGPFVPILRSARLPRFRRSWLLGLVFAAACDKELGSPPAPDAAGLRAAVTEDVARGLGPDGRFRPGPIPAETYPQITPEHAADIALAWARTFGQYVRGEMERRHGKPIDFAALRAGSPAYYAAAAYEPVPRDVHPGFRNAFGPQYLVYLSDDEGPVFSVAVAAFTEATVENGTLILPSRGGMEVVPLAVPSGRGVDMPATPEQAAVIASRATAAQVAAVPELFMPGRGYHPQHSRWKVTLDRPVQARGVASGAVRSTREVYVGLRGEITMPAEAQPAGTEIFDRDKKQMVGIPRRSARAVAFERVTFVTHQGAREPQ